MSTTNNEPNSRYVMVFIGDDSIEQEDELKVLAELENIHSSKNDTLVDLLLNSNGGNIYSAHKIVNILRSRCKKMRVIIPHYAKSAATLMALGADEIVMGQQSELGPLDAPMEHPLIEGIHLSALDGVKPLEFLSDFCSHFTIEVLGLKIRQGTGLGRKESVELALEFASEFVNPIIGKLDPLVINMCYRRLKIAERYGRQMLTSYMFKDDANKDEKATSTIQELVWNYPEHGYAICCNEARQIHLKIIEAEAFSEWNNLWNLFLQLKQRNEKIIQLIPPQATPQNVVP